MRARHALASSVCFAALGIGMALGAPEASACGGCFPPPGENQSVVTDHRMILSVSKQQTTLYDQIQYSGSPSSFAWVLPISGTVEVGLSADTLFGALQNLTSTVVQSPPTRCPGPTNCDYRSSDEAQGAGGTGGNLADPSAPPPVDVLKRETVGPYETVQLRSADPTALNTWLTQNGFAIPADVQPVIAAYVNEKFDFLALKLIPGQGVQSMRPVRITSQGASPVLPLRMVAAGTGAVVGVSLWVVGEGRYEPQNFPFFMIGNDDLTWDWATNASDYATVRADRTTKLAGRGWEVESSLNVNRSQIQNVVTRLAQVNPSVGSDYAPVEENGQVVKTADQVRAADLEALWKGIAPGQDRITRMRADLAHAALNTDLALVASADQAMLPNLRMPTLEKGQPLCTVYVDCRAVGSAPRDEAIAQSKGSGDESFACESAGKRSPMGMGGTGLTAAGGLAAFVALALARGRRARAGAASTEER